MEWKAYRHTYKDRMNDLKNLKDEKNIKVKTFPHHKHLSDGTVVEAYEIVLEKILKSIETKIGVKP